MEDNKLLKPKKNMEEFQLVLTLKSITLGISLGGSPMFFFFFSGVLFQVPSMWEC